MNKNVILYALIDCPRCHEIKKLFDENSISYETIYCEAYPESCDAIEDFLNCMHYPICKIQFGQSETLYFFLSQNYSDLKKVEINKSIYKRGFMTIDDMFFEIKNS